MVWLSRIAIVVLCWSCAAAEQLELPVKVSADHRYFVDQKERPIFWLGTTQWELFRRYSLEEAQLIIDRSKAHGFIFVQVMIPGVGKGTGANLKGEKTWNNDDPSTPNEAYFKHVDAVLKLAGERGLIMGMFLYHKEWKKVITPEKARAWAKWLGTRYKDTPNIYWTLTPEAKAEYLPVLRELAAGLKEGDGGKHMIGVEPDPSPKSSSFIHAEAWMDFNTIQTWKDVKLIYPMVTHDYKLMPTKPVVMAEGAYEAGSEYGFKVTPLWVRRQAYYSYFCGAHHAYGHNDSWRVLPAWKAALDAPGAEQMRILRAIMTEREEWWKLVPDQSILDEGGNTDGDVLCLGARHAENKWAMVYVAKPTEISVRHFVRAPNLHVHWIDPRTGESIAAVGGENGGNTQFYSPKGWEDAVLVIEGLDLNKGK